MKILILTDHQTHSEHNSVYGISRALIKQQEVSELWIASRSSSSNQRFFNGQAMGEIQAVAVDENFAYPADQYFQNEQTIPLYYVDFVFLRLPRPLHPKFLQNLIQNFPENKIVNRPSGILKTSNKAFLLSLKRYTAPMQLCKTIEDIRAFHQRFPIVLKPLEEYGGKGIIRIVNNRVWKDQEKLSFADFEDWYSKNRQEYLGMKFLKNVTKGDKRIVVAGGEILTAALRLPEKGQWLCNVAQGGRSETAEVDTREIEIVKYLSPMLLELGIFYYGLDTLVDDSGHRVISEINTLSIGGIAPSEKISGRPVNRIFAESLVSYFKSL